MCRWDRKICPEVHRLASQGLPRNEDGILEGEENFDEAVKSVNTALVPTRVCLTFRI